MDGKPFVDPHRKNEQPCDSYFGNVCTGFGGTTNCEFCGWDMNAHEEYIWIDGVFSQ